MLAIVTPAPVAFANQVWRPSAIGWRAVKKGWVTAPAILVPSTQTSYWSAPALACQAKTGECAFVQTLSGATQRNEAGAAIRRAAADRTRKNTLPVAGIIF
jgi:hypothetical protein